MCDVIELYSTALVSLFAFTHPKTVILQYLRVAFKISRSPTVPAVSLAFPFPCALVGLIHIPFDSGNACCVVLQLGGYDALNAAVNIFYDKLMADQFLAPFFEGIPMDRLKAKQVSIISKALLIGVQYLNRPVQICNVVATRVSSA